MRVRLLAVVLAALAGVVNVTPSLACTCIPTSDEELVTDADAVFSGTPVAVRDVSTGGPLTDDSIAAVWTFAIDAVQKGDLADTTEVQSALDASVCGMTFELGHRYRLFAQAGAQQLQTTVCLGTTELGPAATGPRCSGAPE